jgi:hypothetical protein
MPILFQCPACQAVCQVLDQHAMQKVRCGCGALVLVPAADPPAAEAQVFALPQAGAGSPAPAGKAAARPGRSGHQAKAQARTADAGTADAGTAVSASVSLVLAGMLLVLTAAAAFVWTRMNQEKPTAPPDQVIVANASAPAATTDSEPKPSLTKSAARFPDQPVASTSVQPLREKSSRLPVMPRKTQPARPAEPPPIADKSPPAKEAAALAKRSAASETTPRAEMPDSGLPTRPAEAPKKIARDAAPAKLAPAPPPTKPQSEVAQRKAPPSPSPAPTSSASDPMADAMVSARDVHRALKGEQLRFIDEYALAAPPDAEQSVPALAAYLIKPARTDVEKVRAIYRWMTDRIAYDVDSFLRKVTPDNSAEGVLKRRLAVCEGYSTLFGALCMQAGVEAIKVQGHGKGFGYEPGQSSGDLNHTWNAVKVNGGWHLMDVTWAAGHLSGTQYVKSREDFYYLTPPDQLIYGHLPAEPRWQLLGQPLSFATWDALPRVDPLLFAAGFSSDQIKKAIHQKGFRGLVKIHKPGGLPYVIREAPLDGHLAAGSTLRVRIESTHFEKIAIVNEGRWHYLTKGPGGFTGEATVQRGTVQVSVLLPGKGNSYWGILEYVVDEKSTDAREDLPEARNGRSIITATVLLAPGGISVRGRYSHRAADPVLVAY